MLKTGFTIWNVLIVVAVLILWGSCPLHTSFENSVKNQDAPRQNMTIRTLTVNFKIINKPTEIPAPENEFDTYGTDVRFSPGMVFI